MEFKCNLSSYQWSKLYEYLRNYPRIHTNNEEKTKQFVEAIFWIARSGAQWRLLPEEFGKL